MAKARDRVTLDALCFEAAERLRGQAPDGVGFLVVLYEYHEDQPLGWTSASINHSDDARGLTLLQAVMRAFHSKRWASAWAPKWWRERRQWPSVGAS